MSNENEVLDLIQHVNTGDKGKFVSSVTDILSQRAADLLQDVRKDVAAAMFAPEVEPDDDNETGNENE